MGCIDGLSAAGGMPRRATKGGAAEGPAPAEGARRDHGRDAEQLDVVFPIQDAADGV